MTDSKIYRVPVPEMNIILPVKVLSMAEEEEFYNVVRAKLTDSTKPFSVEEYQTFITRSFVADIDEFFDMVPEDYDDTIEAVRSAYESICTVYPHFSLEFLCSDLNTEAMVKIIKSSKGRIPSKEGKASDLFKSLQLGSNLSDKAKDTPPVSLSCKEDVEAIRTQFKKNIIGQSGAIKSVCKSLKLMAAGLAKHSSFLFVGPTGVGKTEVARILGENFSGNFFKVNCAEYAGGHEYAKLIGSPPGYVGHSEKSLLAEKSEQSNSWVFLFDEIEKAHHKLYDFLLSLLDEGTCTDNMGKTLDFSKSVFIFTSNQGMSNVRRGSVGFGNNNEDDGVVSATLRESVKDHFSPEFLNRLDDIIVFDHLTKKEAKKIAELQLKKLPIIVTDSLLNFIVEGGYSQEYGARNIQRFIKQNVSNKLADAILDMRIPKTAGEYRYTPRIEKGEVRIINTENLEETA